MLAALALIAAPESFAQAESVIADCREAYVDQARGWGGWIGLAESAYGGVLCIYTSITEADIPRVRAVEAELRRTDVDGLVLASSGGSVEHWLDLMEAAGAPLDFAIVDQGCTSSCANYGFVAGRKRIVPEGALVAWHGGPTGNPDFLTEWWADVTGGAALDRVMWRRIIEDGERTEALYAAAGVSTEILEVSHFASPPLDISARIDAPHVIAIAYEPEVLERCYGFDGLELMTHPGGNAATLAESRRRLRGDAVISRPRDWENGCPADWRR